MRGDVEKQPDLIVTVSPEDLVPRDHPIRLVKKVADEALRRLGPRLGELYSERGRKSVPPEMLLKAQILIALYSVRSERLFCERLQYDFLFRWFLDLPGVGTAFDATTFSKNRERLLSADIYLDFFTEVVEEARRRRLLSDDHFTVDGTMIEANASLKSFRSRQGGGKPPASGGRNAEVDFKGEERKNDTHASTTDPDAKLYRRGNGQVAQMAFLGHALMENRNGLCVGATVTEADGWGERSAALELVEAVRGKRRITLGADKAYDTHDFVDELRERNVTPHVTQNTSGRRSAIDGRTTRHPGYAVSQVRRKRVEEIFGWVKATAGKAKTRFRGIHRVTADFLSTMTAYNLIRIARLEPAAA